MPAARSNATSRKSISISLVSMMIVTDYSLKRAMVIFLILSNIEPLVLLIAASPSSLYKVTLSFPCNLDDLFRR